jgi:hypothetical protein
MHRFLASIQTMELNILQHVVAGSEEPSHLDLSLLQSITENFSEQRKIGVGGCGEVYKVTTIFYAWHHTFMFAHFIALLDIMVMALLIRIL